MRIPFIALSTICLFLSGCSGGKGIIGSGAIDIETRKLEPFNFVQFRGGGEIEIVPGEQPEITITFDDNLLTNIATRIEGPMLVIAPINGMTSRHTLKAKVTAPALEGIAIDGGATMKCGPFNSTNFVIRVTGRGIIEPIGTAERLEIKINGSGNISATKLLARDANLTIVGSGTINVHATNRVAVKIVGNGTIGYAGNPQDVSQSIQGSGSVKAL